MLSRGVSERLERGKVEGGKREGKGEGRECRGRGEKEEEGRKRKEGVERFLSPIVPFL
jgi:hypothetical protein